MRRAIQSSALSLCAQEREGRICLDWLPLIWKLAARLILAGLVRAPVDLVTHLGEHLGPAAHISEVVFPNAGVERFPRHKIR